MKKYLDKNDKEIKEGMTIKHRDGEIEKVYKITDQFCNDDLGVLASNPKYLESHPEASAEYYPLSEFDMKDWEVIE